MSFETGTIGREETGLVSKCKIKFKTLQNITKSDSQGKTAKSA